MFLADYICTSSKQSFSMVAIGCLQGRKDSPSDTSSLYSYASTVSQKTLSSNIFICLNNSKRMYAASSLWMSNSITNCKSANYQSIIAVLISSLTSSEQLLPASIQS